MTAVLAPFRNCCGWRFAPGREERSCTGRERRCCYVVVAGTPARRCRIPRRSEARPALARWISALDTVILCTAAVAAPGHAQEGPSSAAPIRQLVGRSAVGSSFGQGQHTRGAALAAPNELINRGATPEPRSA